MSVTRRRFVKGTLGAVGLGVTAPLWGHIRLRSDEVRVAFVGVGGRGDANLNAVAGVDGVRVVALCDVDAQRLGAAAAAHPEAATHADYRRMLDRAAEFDAVVVSTPDHTHAFAAAAALHAGKAVYCEKPLCRTVKEVRTLQRLADSQGVATQMGTQIHAGDNYRRVVELIRAGAIGQVREAHVWCGKSWSDGRFAAPSSPPDHLEWDLWLGPAPKRAFSEGIHPGNWRRFWSYGTGTLGDMACHYVDLVHWALDLGAPERIAAEGPDVHPDGTPRWLHVTWDHPARGDLAPVRLHWYDGGRRPDVLSQLTHADGSALQWGDGQLFVGDKGMIISDYGRHVLLPEADFEGFEPPAPSIPTSIGHHAEWIKSVRTGSATTCNFDYSGALTEAVLLGNIAYRTGRTLQWDAGRAECTNVPEAAGYVSRPARSGWSL